MTIVGESEVAPDFAEFGIRAFTTTRSLGSFGIHTDEPVRDVMGRWSELQRELRPAGPRLATAKQVHGAGVLVHHPTWTGWLRGDEADGHVAIDPGTAVAVTVADCVPVFLAHPSGAIALLHSGWRGTAARIVERGIEALVQRRLPASEIRLHAGPAICGGCYEVSADVYERLTGKDPGRPTTIDLRALIADHARARGVRHITISDACTRCNNDRFYSHRAGDAGRQVSVMLAEV
jgi:purine-nucleoside/S-methyl-5'-thioadenosine phosphorylase / adenosine deaminase